ncbi:MAG TPA: ABC transporter permease [Myxococcota bacterium]|nr:ABC transporter permease [Myxococcota bacterium]
MKDAVNNRRSVPGALGSLMLLARMFFKVNLGRRRMIWLALACVVPLGLAIYWRIAEQGAGLAFFDEMTVNVFLQFFALGLPLYLGVSAVRDEIDDKTIVYLFARPLRRAVVLGSKMISVAMLVTFVLAIDLALAYVIIVSADGFTSIMAGLGRLFASIGVLATAALVYTAVFSLIGVLLRRPMILAILFGLGWEAAVSNLPGAFPRLTLMYYLKSLLGLGPQSHGMMSLLIPSITPAPVSEALEVLLITAIVLFSASFYVASHKEYRV